MTIDTKEALRYLGYRGREADPRVLLEITACSQEILNAAVPRHRVVRVPVERGPEGALTIAGFL